MRKETILDIPAAATPLGGRARQLVDNPDVRIVNLELKPGEEVKSHLAPVDVVFIVISGTGQVKLEDDFLELLEGQMLVCPTGLERSIQAGDEGLNLIVVRAPNPAS